MRDQRDSTARPHAFTVLELLIVTAIMGSLVGLLLPALMAARESARCLQCKSNLREIGVAIQQYHAMVKRLPEAWTAGSDHVSGFGWAVALLPYLEESNIASQIYCRLPASARQNDSARNADLPIMRCPSDISAPMFDLFVEQPPTASVRTTRAGTDTTGAENAPLMRLPAANYLGVFGTLEADETYPAPPGDGAIVSNRKVRYCDLQRGQSRTIIIGERTAAMAPSTWYGVNFRGEDAACRLVGSAITSPNCETCDECEFSSRHAGGANFVWADGHVSLVLSDIDMSEYQQISKRRMD